MAASKKKVAKMTQRSRFPTLTQDQINVLITTVFNFLITQLTPMLSDPSKVTATVEDIKAIVPVMQRYFYHIIIYGLNIPITTLQGTTDLSEKGKLAKIHELYTQIESLLANYNRIALKNVRDCCSKARAESRVLTQEELEKAVSIYATSTDAAVADALKVGVAAADAADAKEEDPLAALRLVVEGANRLLTEFRDRLGHQPSVEEITTEIARYAADGDLYNVGDLTQGQFIYSQCLLPLLKLAEEVATVTDERDVASRAQVVTVTGERDAARAQVDTVTGERDVARAQVVTVTGERDTAIVDIARRDAEILRLGKELARLNAKPVPDALLRFLRQDEATAMECERQTGLRILGQV